MLFVGNDWAEAHHDVEVVDESGRCLVRRRFVEGIAGMAELHAMIADHLPVDAEASEVVIGIETDRGPWVTALVAAGYQVYAINPMQVARYRERHSTSGAKSDRGDAHVLAELVRLDRAHHQVLTPDSELAEAIKVLARVHQNLIWTRQRQANQLRSMLREYYPAALVAFNDLAGRDALAVLAAAPTPAAGHALSVEAIIDLLQRAGRRRYLTTTAEKIHHALQAEHLQARPQIAQAYGASTRALVSIMTELGHQIDRCTARWSRIVADTPTVKSI
jgi:transposase